MGMPIQSRKEDSNRYIKSFMGEAEDRENEMHSVGFHDGYDSTKLLESKPDHSCSPVLQLPTRLLNPSAVQATSSRGALSTNENVSSLRIGRAIFTLFFTWNSALTTFHRARC